VYGVWHTKGGLGGGRIYAIVVCNSVGNADGEGRKGDASLVHKSFDVDESLVTTCSIASSQSSKHSYIYKYIYVDVCIHKYTYIHIYREIPRRGVNPR